MGRYFTKRQKEAVAIVDGKDSRLEGDHIKPVIIGGETAVENCQLLTRESNASKGSHFMQLRQWQVEFAEKWDARKSGRPFLLVAIPGGGKTFAALSVAKNWLAAGNDRRIIVVVPTSNLRKQWMLEAAKLGMQLQTKEFGTNFKDGFSGAVTTYTGVSQSPLVFRVLCSRSPVLVILDEMHHCGDSAAFGISVKEAFELSKEKLLMSGTPWRTTGDMIPFVSYDGGGYCVSDYFYDYPRALRDEVVRYLVFFHAQGSITYESGLVEELHQGISDDEASQRLRKLLDPNGEFVRQQIRDAHRKLLECRKEIPDAAGMAACIDQIHADKIAAAIKEETGCIPSVIVSDSDYANDSVTSFNKSHTEWLVSVRQVSEGTDIKRLQVLCYFTNWVTDLFFRQLIGRVSRVRGMEDYEAYVYLPADPRLVAMATTIEESQKKAIVMQAADEERESRTSRECKALENFYTQHNGIEVFVIGNKSYPLEIAKQIERLSESVGVSMDKTARIFEAVKSGSLSIESEPKHAPSQPKELEMDGLRKQCSREAWKLSKVLGVHVAEVHSDYKKQEQMSESELRIKLSDLRSRIVDGR